MDKAAVAQAHLASLPMIAIVGPTASGKSALADEVAQALGSCVTSIDAMQVYRGMDIGTAKTPEAERRVPLKMVDVVDPSEEYSVALFQKDARCEIDRQLAAGLTPVLCGGTGLYLDAVIDEMDFPEGGSVSPVRQKYEALLAQKGEDYLWELLNKADPQSAQIIHPHNTRRVIRALELHEKGESYGERTQHLKQRDSHYNCHIYAVVRDREELYSRIDMRVDEMFDQGLVAEVQALKDLGIQQNLTARQAIGYKEVLAALDNQSSLDEARALIKRNTRRYAKRQLSWLRRDGRATTLDLDRLSLAEARDLILNTYSSQ